MRGGFTLLCALAASGAGAQGLTIEEWGAPEPDAGSVTVEALPVSSEDAGQPAPFEADTRLVPVAPLEEIAVETSSPGASAKDARVFGTVRTAFGADTRHESVPRHPLAENVVELGARANLGVDLSLSDSVRLFVEGRARFRSVAERGLYRTKAEFQAELGEAFLDLYSPRVDLRVGHQVIAFGANAAFAPTDNLNPRDFRDGLFATDPELSKLPAFGARAVGELRGITATAVWMPFFSPHRYTVFGQDEALLQPALGQVFPLEVHESIEDELQPHLLETRRPLAFPWLGDFGLRLQRPSGRVKLGASWTYINEKIPAPVVDPELQAVLAATGRGEDPNPALLLSVQNRLRAGEQLVDGRYFRQHQFGVEASTLIGSSQVDLDLGYSPAQTFFDATFAPVRKQTVTWVLGVSQAEDSPLLYGVTYLGLLIPDLSPREFLLLLEPATAQGAPRTALFHLFAGQVQYALLDDALELSLSLAFEPMQRSFMISPRVAYDVTDDFEAFVGADVSEGKPFSPFGYFNRNDRVFAGARWSFL